MDGNRFAQHPLSAWVARVLRYTRQHALTRENLAALALCLIFSALVIATADSAPQWIYQGF